MSKAPTWIWWVIGGAGTFYAALVAWVCKRVLHAYLHDRRRDRRLRKAPDVTNWQVDTWCHQLERADDGAIWRELQELA
jgi:hypothetical protein